MKKSMKKISAVLLTVLCAVSLLLAAALTQGRQAVADDGAYYVCFSDQNYAVRNANKMSATGDGEYILQDVSLDSDDGFYVTDGADIKYYASDGNDMAVDSSDTLRYDIKFNPSQIYDEENTEDGWTVTDCRITYRLYSPGDVSVMIGDEEYSLTYNSYRSAYDEYYLSSVYIEAGTAVTAEGETHEVSSDGYYRIVYTPGATTNGNTYLYDEDGNYGSGDGYDYHLYIEDAPRYFLVFTDAQPDVLPEQDGTVDGDPAYLLSRYEDNVSAEEYRSGEFFLFEPDSSLRYAVYEEQANGTFRLLDDDDDEDTDVEKLRFTDAGWYSLSFIPADTTYVIATVEETTTLDGFYLAGNFNDWGYDEEGNITLSDEYLLEEVEDDDDYYDEDYTQYSVELTVTDKDLKDEDIEFYITDGDTKYRNLTKNIVIDEAGTYRILFSDEHVYGNGRRYRYFLTESDSNVTEVLISTAEDWQTFAAACNVSADYSYDKSVYLTADIDFSGVDFTPVKQFHGTFYGGYHTLSGIEVPEDAAVNGVFGTVSNGAVVERLYVEDLSVSDTDDDYAGFVCVNYGTLRCLEISGSVEGGRYVGGVCGYNGRTLGTGASSSEYDDGAIERCTNAATVSGYASVGGICGFNYGEISQSCNEGKVVGTSDSSNDTVIALGGIAGYSAGRIVSSENQASVSSSLSSLYVGGIAGVCTGDIYFSFNRGNVSGTTYAGGAVGYYGTVSSEEDSTVAYLSGLDYQTIIETLFNDSSDEASVDDIEGTTQYLSYVYNEGNVTAKGYVGGIVGNVTVSISIDNCVSIGNITATAGNYAGGIVGYTDSATVTGCLTAGSISASGMSGSDYVGGICGYGYSVLCSMSAADLDGGDYVGGICGYCANVMDSNYANVTVVSETDAQNVGGIAGYSAQYDEAGSDFNGNVQYNYYVNDVAIGGIAGTDYGENYDYAAAGISSEDLAKEDELSAYLADGFDSEYWAGGDGTATYPVPYYLLNVDIADEYGDDSEFETLFDTYGAEFTAAAKEYTQVSYTILFLEWDGEDDLYDDDGVLQEDVYEVIATIRVFAGDSVTVPDFEYAVLQEDGTWILEADDGWYYVTFVLDGSNTVYAQYRKIATTLTDKTGTVLVEGIFDEDTEVTIVTTSAGMCLVFTLNGEEIEVGTVTVKYLVGEDVDDYAVYFFVAGEEEQAETVVSGSYLAFEYSDGDYFSVRVAHSAADVPGWAWALIGGAAGAVAVGIAWLIVWLVRRKGRKPAKKSPAGETDGNGK